MSTIPSLPAWKLPDVREGYPAPDDLLEKRRMAGGDAPVPSELVRDIAGVRCLVVAAENPTRRMLYFHGGGYRMGSPVAWVPYATQLARAMEAEVILPFYRLAPEHPFPAALHDAVTVYRELAGEGQVLLGGDSAGGGLAAALSIAASRIGAPPAGTVLVSPMLDFGASDETYDLNGGRDQLFSRQAVEDCAALYLQGHSPEDPLVSPLYVEPQDFPPALILIGGDEVLLGEAIAFARKLAMADRRVTLHVAPGVGHVWPMMAPGTQEADDAIAAVATFAAACLP
ncbi:hypothetical protein MB02_04280 [Croceicoccus estronivorus]|uniref:alpha/beta hydrolase n=1 Tax=Croceicoccus estronivorus TaxID=1172626 RepID=UPI0008325D4A|nr:alpha/beta hydrolase [Croceicoccus estronivorus]OCC24702.1 hypothetical protein MB02_04280 [Croceicoccus estronivorus]